MTPARPSDLERSTLAELRTKLEGRWLKNEELRAWGLAPTDKGKWGKANEHLLGIAPNSSPDPDLPDGELKTTVRGLDGAFLQSVKVCMTSQSPMKKLEQVYLVVARDGNAQRAFARREVRNECVVCLRPEEDVRRKLQFDELVLHDDPRSNATHFLETRTAGSRDSTTRAYYLRAGALDRYIGETVVRREAALIERRLRDLRVSDETLRGAGVSLGAKNRVGRFVALRAGPVRHYCQLRQGPVDEHGKAAEDLLVCGEDEQPLSFLWRTVYVAVGPAPRGKDRRVQRVMPLTPTEVVAAHVRRDTRLLRRRGPAAPGTYFLKLKPHGQSGSGDLAFYLDRRYVDRYVGLVSASRPGI